VKTTSNKRLLKALTYKEINKLLRIRFVYLYKFSLNLRVHVILCILNYINTLGIGNYYYFIRIIKTAIGNYLI